MSNTILHFPEYDAISVNSDEAVYQPDSSWVTVVLPQSPRLTPSQIRAVRAKAAELRYNVIQAPPDNRIIPIPGLLFVREKVANPTFCCALTNVPSWVDPNNPETADNDYRDYPDQTSPEFFAKYTSNPGNMGPYYVDGVKQTFDQFMSR
jgi:hypothetical protein